MKPINPVIVALFLAAAAPSLPVGPDTLGKVKPVKEPDKVAKVYVIPVSGDVEPSMAAFIGRSLRQAAQTPDALVVLEMDTFGGRVDAALEIVDTMLTVPAPRTIAFVKTKAISAGALIALSCGRLYMRENTTIGDCAPLTYNNEGPQMLGEKFQSPLRAKFRALAQRNGYPQALSEAMVSEDRVIYKVQFKDSSVFIDSAAFADLPAVRKAAVVSKKTIVGRGTLLTMSAQEARELGFSRGTATSIEAALHDMGVNKFEIVDNKETWSETFARFIGKIAPILMLIGFAAIYLEFKAPGAILPAVVGILCLGLVFGAQYLVGLANYTETLLMILGVALIGFEIFVTPGMFILGITGVLCIGVGLLLSFQNFVIPSPSMPWQADLLAGNLLKILGSLFLALVLSVALFRFVLPRLGFMSHGPYLMTSLKDVHAESIDAISVKVGDIGSALTPLRPSGKAVIGGEHHDVVTHGDFIEKGTAIVIVEISNNRIIVTRKSA